MAVLCAALVLGLGVPVAQARTVRAGRPLDWGACATAGGWQCATASVPKVYGGHAGYFTLAVTRLPASDQQRKIGSLFINYGGPGASAVDVTQARGERWFAPFHKRFDLVAFDPRGTGATSQAIDCHANQETQGVGSQPFFEPGGDWKAYWRRVQSYWDQCQARNPGVVPYATTGNYARDMDLLRQSLGERKVNYIGYSYGTFIGETYAAMFPHRYRAMVLDSAFDPDMYINRPMSARRVQIAGFERALGRFMMACAARQDFCSFGGSDPYAAFDRLVARANQTPIPASGEDPRPVTGDDILAAALETLYSRYGWTDLAKSLNQAEVGDGTGVRQLVDEYGRRPDGTYDPLPDRTLALSAERRYPTDLQSYVNACEESWEAFHHFWFAAGCVELYWRALPKHVAGAFYGPFRLPASAPTPLVVGTRYDPATPYRWARAAVREMGNARLLTMNGDGHGAFRIGGSTCIDNHVVAYVLTLHLPREGTQCDQQVPFPLPPEAQTTKPPAIASVQQRDVG